MSNLIDATKKKFLEDNDLLYYKEFLPQEENDKLSEEYIDGDSLAKDKILEVYDYDYDTKNCKFHFYKLVPLDIGEKEMDTYISIKMLENVKAVNEKLDTIKFVIVFWFIVTILVILFFAFAS